MVKCKIDRLAWFRKKDVDVEAIKKRLTISVAQFSGPAKVFRMYEEKEKLIGVPRMWAVKNYKLDVIDRTTFIKMKWPKMVWPEGYDWWPGQKKSVQSIARNLKDGKFGTLLEAACGTGKTFMSIAAAARMKTPMLVMVHKNDLAEQWRETAQKFFPGVRIGHVQQDKWDFQNCHIVTAMAQTMYKKRFSIPKDFWNNFGITAFDEGHRYSAKTFEQVLAMSKTRHRLACSATWRRKDGLTFVWEWHIGSIDQVAKGVKLTGEYVNVPWNTRIEDSMYRIRGRVNQPRMLTMIGDNKPYNNWIAAQCINAAKVGRRYLIVSDRIDQLLDVRSRILKKGDGFSVGLYSSSAEYTNPEKKRRRKVKKDELTFAKNCDIILATYQMMNEGTDIPALDTLLLATPKSDIEQIVGRIQRHQEGKKALLVVNPFFTTTYQTRLGMKRAEALENLGFTERITE